MNRSIAGTALACLSWILMLAGCGEPVSNRTSVYPTAGIVTSKGEPAVGVHLILHRDLNGAPSDEKLFPNGITDEAGRYQLTTYEKNDGAPPGEWIVTLSWPDDRLTPAVREEILSSGESLPDRYRGRFSKPAGSKWRVSVSEGDNEIPPIDIP